MCSAGFQTDDADQMTCARCADLPSTHFQLVANDRHGSPYTVLTGSTIRGGKSCSDAWYRGLAGGTMYDTIRKWAADAVANGATDVRVEFSRHTRNLGWSSDLFFQRGAACPYRTVRLDVKPQALRKR